MWIVEEKCEDAFVAYLRANVPGSMRVYPAWTDEEIQYPCAVCKAGDSDNENDEAKFNGHRRVAVEIAVMTEATPELDAAGVKVCSTRDRNAVARDAVIKTLAKSALHEDLNEMAVPGIKFSQAHMTKGTRGLDGRVLVSIINVDCIANPTTT